MFEVTVKTDLKAAHQLRFQGGKCERLHGHNWQIEVTVQSEKLNEWGAVIDFQLLKSRLDETLKIFDHHRIDLVAPFDTLNPTAENLARFIFEKLSKDPEITLLAKVKKVTVGESRGMLASYFSE